MQRGDWQDSKGESANTKMQRLEDTETEGNRRNKWAERKLGEW